MLDQRYLAVYLTVIIASSPRLIMAAMADVHTAFIRGNIMTFIYCQLKIPATEVLFGREHFASA